MKLNTKKGWKSLVSLKPNRQNSSRFSMFQKLKAAGQTAGCAPVYLNVYDLTPVNGYVYWAGIGIYHSGIEVHGVEYAFGAHDFPSSGVFEVEPKQCPGFRFRKSIFMGTTRLDPLRIREFMEVQSANYNGDMYHLITKNCNHFCKDICQKLTGNKIPKWVNRLARIGAVCNCVLPSSMKIAAVRQDPDCESEESERRHLTKTSFSCFSSISVSQKSTHSCSSLLRPSSPQKGCLPPW